MNIFLTILSIIAFAIITLVIYNVLKVYVLDNIKINKWIVLAVAIVLFIAPILIWPSMPKYIANYAIPGLFVILLLWFMDLSGFMKDRKFFNFNSKGSSSSNVKYDKKNDVVMRPKAKPNRNNNNKK